MKKHLLIGYIAIMSSLLCPGCTDSKEIDRTPVSTVLNEAYPDSPLPEDTLSDTFTYNYYLKQQYELFLDQHITKDFLMGKIKRTDNAFFQRVGKEHTERNIYLLAPVYEAYKKMYEAALSDNVKLMITSGHRTFVEQVCEWELRWNNPLTDISFANDTEKARYLLEYRSMPGTSRHHWGTDIDLNSFKLSYFETKEGKNVYEWLQNNAHLYGFYQPYTQRDENRPVGYNEEKWHWSYRPIAQIMLGRYLQLVDKEDIRGFKGDKAVMSLDIIGSWVCGIAPDMFDLN